VHNNNTIGLVVQVFVSDQCEGTLKRPTLQQLLLKLKKETK